MPSDSSPQPRPHSLAVTLGLVVAVVLGTLTALQSRINGGLAHELGDATVAALVSFGSGLAVLAVGMLVWRPARSGAAALWSALRTRSIPWWYVAGGTAGAFFVLTQSLTAALLGVALFTVATVAGQILSGLVIDRRGLGTMRPQPVTPPRVVGSALALVAVVIAVSAQLRGDAPVWALVLPFLAGLGIGWQQGVNGQVRAVARSALTATFVNFVVGTALLLVAALVHTAFVGWPTNWPPEPWLYLGGVIGLVFIAGSTVIVRITGVLLMGLAFIAGQLVMSVVIDVMFPVAGRSLAVTTVVGTALTLVAVAIAAVPALRRSASAVPPTGS